VQVKDVAANAAVSIWAIVERNKVVGFWDNLDAQRRTMNEMDDFLYDEIRGTRNIALTTEEMDEIIDRSMQLARHRMPA
jgi:type I restriction enzyme R subunit